MCTVQGCPAVATFVLTGAPAAAAGQRVVAAYCDLHATEAAARINLPAPTAEGDQTSAAPRRAFRAG